MRRTEPFTSRARLGPALAAAMLLAGAAAAGEVRRPGAEGESAFLAPPLVVDCGPPSDERPQGAGSRSESGLLRLPDRRWSEETGYGFEGGEGYRIVIPAVWGVPDADRYMTGRRDPRAYRFALRPGRYVVTLGFCELKELLPDRRSFDIPAVEDRRQILRTLVEEAVGVRVLGRALGDVARVRCSVPVAVDRALERIEVVPLEEAKATRWREEGRAGDEQVAGQEPGRDEGRGTGSR